MTARLGFIGAGNMAEAIARAAIDRGVLAADAMVACDVSEARRDVFKSLGIETVGDASTVIERAEQVVLAVKPQSLPGIAADLAKVDSTRQVVISIMAGISSARIADAAGKPLRVIRVMPNTPLMVGCGMTGVALGAHAEAGDENLAMALFGAAGEAVLVSEQAIDAITAVSGSGPAYLFYMAEAMQRAAEQLGLQEHASLLVEQTLLGAAKLLRESRDTPAELRRKVTSPGGTTEAAIRHLDGNKTQDVIVNAIKAAQQRSIELGKG